MICPRCSTKMYGEYVPGGSSSMERTTSGLIMATAQKCPNCAHYVWDEPKVVRPGLPEPDRPFTKSDLFKAGIQGRKTTRQVVKEHLPAIKFWIFNQSTLQECCDKLKAKGHNISAPSLSKHLRKIAAQEAV